MILRKATLKDVALLQYWDTKPHVQWATGEDGETRVKPDPDEEDWPGTIAQNADWQDILIAEETGRPIGVIQIIDPHLEETHYWGACAPNQRAIDIWIGEETDLGRGYGTQMMGLAIQRCFAPPEVTAILIDPLLRNKKAIRFYRRLGFADVEERWFEGDHCLVMQLARADWERTSSD